MFNNVRWVTPMSSRLWILITSLLLLPVSCKQEAPAKKQAAEDNSAPEYIPPAKLPETKVPDEEVDDCEKDKKEKEDDSEESSDEVTDEEEESEMELRLTGQNKDNHLAKADTKVKAKATKKNKKKTAKVKKDSAPTGLANIARGFGLLASSPNYDDDISSILKDKCETCHSGSDPYAMDSYKKAKKLKTKIKSQISSGDMPPENKSPLTSKEKTAIKDWVTAGAPETSDDTGSSEDEGEEEVEEEETEEEDNTSSTSDCGEDKKEDEDKDEDEDDSENSSDNTAGWDELLKKKEVEKCKDKGKIFDRLTETCHKAKVAGFSCDKSGIEGEFKKVGVNVSSQISGFLSDGYSIDQCGEFSNEPIVLFYKKETVKEELKLLIKKLCKKGSAACDN
jgi:hypothetical protein